MRTIQFILKTYFCLTFLMASFCSEIPKSVPILKDQKNHSKQLGTLTVDGEKHIIAINSKGATITEGTPNQEAQTQESNPLNNSKLDDQNNLIISGRASLNIDIKGTSHIILIDAPGCNVFKPISTQPQKPASDTDGDDNGDGDGDGDNQTDQTSQNDDEDNKNETDNES
ncbi:hypothetical protein [Cardinium endosymbiont of Nabis limbatus]|uniref:hypothetical protein n=1 Tax=Cardinium endosymbiont of Nabis limbatus TaxID=3066217 RepID=UPI003AF408EB